MLTEHGVSTTIERDCFRYETYHPTGKTHTRIQWDYRDSQGVLHSGIARDLPSAQASARRFGYQGE